MCNIQVQNSTSLIYFLVDLCNILGMGVNVMRGINKMSSGAISVEYRIICGESFE